MRLPDSELMIVLFCMLAGAALFALGMWVGSLW